MPHPTATMDPSELKATDDMAWPESKRLKIEYLCLCHSLASPEQEPIDSSQVLSGYLGIPISRNHQGTPVQSMLTKSKTGTESHCGLLAGLSHTERLHYSFQQKVKIRHKGGLVEELQKEPPRLPCSVRFNQSEGSIQSHFGKKVRRNNGKSRSPWWLRDSVHCHCFTFLLRPIFFQR